MKRILILIILILMNTGCVSAEPPEYTISIGEPVPITKEVKLAIVGDIMVHDYQYNEAYNPVVEEYNFMHNFQDMKPYFDQADIVVGNLELTFGGDGLPYSSYPMFNTPDSFIDALKDAGFDILTTANNHSMDTKKSGLIRTLDKLDEFGIDHMGTYRTPEEKSNILIKEVNGISIAFLSYTYGTNGIPVPEAHLVNMIDDTLMVEEIKKARKLADIVVVMPHIGNEYETYTRTIFKEWVDLMFQGGADIVLGSHPHVLQPMEYRKLNHGKGEKDGFVIYSLGNFISSQTTPPRNGSIVLNITIKQVGGEEAMVDEVSFMPIWTQFRNADEENHFVVRSVYERLNLSQEEKNKQIRKVDQERLLEIHKETASFLLGKEIPLEEIKNVYVFPKP